MAETASPALPFTLASRASSRQSFQIPNVALQAATPVTPPGTPVQVPAVGYLKNLRIEVTLTSTGGAPALSADAPWNIINQISVKNSAGQPLISPLTGYELYLVNKYGAASLGLTSAVGAMGDPKNTRQYSGAAAGPLHFFLDLPFEFDPSSGLGAIPALASNRSYQVELSLSALSTIYTSAPTSAVVTIDVTADYWDVPVAVTPGGASQQTEPFGLGTVSLWQKEQPIVAPGDQLIRSNNTGNVIRNLILVTRTAAGVRTDADFPGVMELYIDNNPMLRFKKTEWQDFMARAYGYSASALDAAAGLDTGVYVFPFHLLAGGLAADPSNSRAQLLATLDATLLQFKGYGFGASVSTMTVLTQSVASDNAAFIFSK